MMKNILFTVLGFVIAVGVFAYASQNFSVSDTQKDVDRFTGELNEKAKDYDNGLESENIAEAAKDLIKQKSQTKESKEKAAFLFASYLGFKYRQTEGYKEYCADHGVDTSSFSSYFLDVNSEVEGHVSRKVSANFMEQALQPEVKKAIGKMIDDEFAELKRVSGTEPKQLCTVIATEPEMIEQYVDFSRNLPEAYNYIISYEGRL